MVFLLLAGALLATQSGLADARRIDNPYLTIRILPGWTVGASPDQRLNLEKGKYRLTINPVFTHASGIVGGRFSEIVEGMESLVAVTRNVDQPASGSECAQYDALVVTNEISLGNLYTDSSKTGNECVFPASGLPVWFGSSFSGNGPESEYTITLSYDTEDVNLLPRKGSPGLKQVFAEVVAMLKTLRLKPPVIITKVSPQSARPGETVTIHGSGFNPFNAKAVAIFAFITADLSTVVSESGRSLTFQVPTSIENTSCQEGRISTGGFCLPIPPGHVDVNDCPRKNDGSANFCGIPIPPATYQLLIGAGGVSAPPIPFTVIAPQPTPVSISLMYPDYWVSVGTTVTVRGGGFVRTGNSVKIGDTVVNDLASADGKTITFRAPEPKGKPIVDGTRIFKVSVLNANGESNWIAIDYR